MIPQATPSGYKLDLREMYRRLVDKYYPGEHLKWGIDWGHNMTTNSAYTCFRDRDVKVSRYVYKRLYYEDDSENKWRYKKDLEETLLHEMIHVYLYYKYDKKRPWYDENIKHGPSFITEMNRLNDLLENGFYLL